MPDDVSPENPYGQNEPNGADPQNPYNQNPYGQQPGAGNPYGQNPYNQDPYGQPQYNQDPYGQPQHNQPQYNQTLYSATQSATWAWQRFIQNAGLYLALGFLTLAIPAAITIPVSFTTLNASSSPFAFHFSFSGFVSGVISAAVMFVFLLAIAKAAILTARTGQRASFNEVFSGINWANTLLIGLVYGLVSEVASTVFVLLGLAAMFLLVFLPVVVAISPDADLATAFKASVNTVTSNFGSSALLVLFCILFAVAGFAACCVGLVAAVPIIQLALSHGFLRLTGQPVVE